MVTVKQRIVEMSDRQRIERDAFMGEIERLSRRTVRADESVQVGDIWSFYGDPLLVISVDNDSDKIVLQDMFTEAEHHSWHNRLTGRGLLVYREGDVNNVAFPQTHTKITYQLQSYRSHQKDYVTIQTFTDKSEALGIYQDYKDNRGDNYRLVSVIEQIELIS